MPRGPVLELPTSLRGARWAPTRSAATAVLLVALLVALVFGVRVWVAGAGGQVVAHAGGSTAAPSGVSRGTATLSRASPSGSVTGRASAPGTRGAEAAPPGAAASPGTAVGVVVVHVVGQVATAGVYRLSVGARIADAVQAAGGATRAADLAAVNLARVVVDGEQIHVPRPGEVVAPPGGSAGGPAPGAANGGGGAGGGAGTGGGGLVALNSADLSALDTLPGVGPVLAQRILDWRTEHGRFTSVEELGEVSGIGDKLLSQITPRVTL